MMSNDLSSQSVEKLLAIGAGSFAIVASIVLEFALFLPLSPAQLTQIKDSKGVLWERGLTLMFGTGVTSSLVSVFRKKGRGQGGFSDDTPFVPPVGDMQEGGGEWLDSLIQSDPTPTPPPDENISTLMGQGYSYEDAIAIMNRSSARSPGE